jgi:hypothetical protein
MGGHSTDAERGLGSPGAGDGGTILAATQARHWCEIVIGLGGETELSLSADREAVPGS